MCQHERKLISTDILKLKYLFIIQNDMYHYLLNLKISAKNKLFHRKSILVTSEYYSER